VHHRTDDGKAFRTLNILDEHSRECLAIRKRPVEPRCQAFLACQFQGMSSSMRLIL
jgi:hypothetical protein